MSSPACADGYDTPAQQREDSTTFISGCHLLKHSHIISAKIIGRALELDIYSEQNLNDQLTTVTVRDA